MSDSTLTLISLADTRLHAPLISHELFILLTEARAKWEKVALLYNRRGSGRAWICQDCGYYPLCPHCDIAFAYHTSPHRTLLCHQCNTISWVTYECPKCHGHHFDAVGIGIQRLADDVTRLVPESQILRLDADTGEKKEALFHTIGNTDILLGTYSSLGLMSEVDHVVFVLFESDLTIPDYRMEEELYHAVHLVKKLEKNILIQTRMTEHPLIDVIMQGNYKDFLQYMSQERKIFHYPPYADFITLRVHDRSQDRVKDIITKLVNKISLLKSETTFLAYDRDIWERRAGEYIQKIILKDTDLSSLLLSLQVELMRNRSVTLEWR